MTVKPLVAAADGSDESLQAIEWAAREAVLRSAPLRIVAAASRPPRMLDLLVQPDRDFVAGLIREERDRALAAAAARAAEVAPGLQVDTVPLAGPPAQAVTESGSGASMLVLGAHGTGALGSIALGSVSWNAAAHASCPVVIVRGETVAVHREIGIGIGDLDASAEPLTFAFEEASLRQAGLIAVHAWHIPLAAISRAGSPSPVPDLAATVAEAARRLAGLLDNWRKQVPRRRGQPVCRARPPELGAGRLVHPHRPAGHRQARQPARPARPRFSGARRPEPRARPGRGGPVILIWQSKQLRQRARPGPAAQACRGKGRHLRHDRYRLMETPGCLCGLAAVVHAPASPVCGPGKPRLSGWPVSEQPHEELVCLACSALEFGQLSPDLRRVWSGVSQK